MATKYAGNVIWNIYEVFYNEAGIKNLQVSPKQYFSNELKGATVHTHLRVMYDGKEILAKDETKVIKDVFNPIYVSTNNKTVKIPLGSLVTCWVEVEGHPEYSSVYFPNNKSNTYADTTRMQSLVHAISNNENSVNKFSLHGTKRNPVGMEVFVNGEKVPYRKGITDYTLDRYFKAGAKVNIMAQALGYVTKSWVVEMPDEEYVLSEISLEKEK